MQRSRKTVLTAAGVTVFAIAGALILYSSFRRGGVANASPTAELLSLVPTGAPTLIYLDMAALRASNFYQRRPDRAPITVPDRNYANFIQATGFDFEKDLDRVVIAAWPQSFTQDQKKTVAIAEGRFDRQKIRDYAMKNGKLDQQQGHEVFLFRTNNPKAPDAWNSLMFLDDHRLAMVEGQSIAPALDTHPVNGTADPVQERAARVTGAALFVISRTPTIPDNIAPGGMQSAQFAALARSVQWITLAVRPEGENMRVSLEGECKTPTDARQLQSALELLRLLGEAGLESPKTRQSMDPATLQVMETVLKSADITESAERVRVLVEVTPEILKWSGTGKAQ